MIDLAREKANAQMSIDVLNKLKELDKRVAKLETGGMEPEEPGEYLEYVSGKWYYKDNKVTFEGEKYICTAPEGQVCTGRPIEYPVYWQKVE